MFTSSHTGQLRGHSEKIFVTRPRLDICKYLFSQRVIEPLNSLPEDTLSQENVKDFKKILRIMTEFEVINSFKYPSKDSRIRIEIPT